MSNSNEQNDVLQMFKEVLETESTGYTFDDYESTLRQAMCARFADPLFDKDISEIYRLMNLYKLLWLLKPHFSD